MARVDRPPRRSRRVGRADGPGVRRRFAGDRGRVGPRPRPRRDLGVALVRAGPRARSDPRRTPRAAPRDLIGDWRTGTPAPPADHGSPDRSWTVAVRRRG